MMMSTYQEKNLEEAENESRVTAKYNQMNQAMKKNTFCRNDFHLEQDSKLDEMQKMYRNQ